MRKKKKVNSFISDLMKSNWKKKKNNKKTSDEWIAGISKKYIWQKLKEKERTTKIGQRKNKCKKRRVKVWGG